MDDPHAHPSSSRAHVSGCSTTTKKSHKKKKREITNGLNAEPIATLTVPPVDGPNVAIRDPKYIGSYNWVDSPSPTILVPGSPRIWRNKPTPFTIRHDTGNHFCDQNGYRLPSTPLLPILVAVDKMVVRSDVSPISIDWPSVDYITDRNGLRKLLEWVSGKKQSFRIDLQLAGKKTVLCNRWEPQSRLKVFDGYGYNFEDAVTSAAPGCERSSGGHHRVITYDLCGLTMVVRFEVDACHVPHDAPSTSTDFLSAQLASMALSKSTTSTHTVDQRTSLTVISTGKPIPNESVIELTTRKGNDSGIRLRNKYPQLYFSQTPELIIGLHHNGRFTDVQRKTMESLTSLEDSLQRRLGALGQALSDIQDLVVQSGTEGRLSLVGRDKELLVFERVSTASCLPETYLKRFVASG
ncbi:uncharacterized protein EV420DRAFT_1275698 [Desarmillaria tabescens]|uniref:Geranylgeranyl pyrophosphate synthetase n=1 Tax=Armillaria tabescens TaxID=1929756 RepID=A0AA39MWC1_ARMTA|nr:uncharacterized protein EV420DRAFT_1275698 [Desarmillaria tabescens]KAK0448474.1 hypothetical protein EV420DRAFT_1275698 [Desarmillaria tabescens]